MPESIRQAIDLLDQLPPYAIIGVFAVFVLAILGLGQMLRKPSSRLIAFSGESGSVSVSRKALQDLIKQTCLKDQSVYAARPTVKIAGSKIHTHVDLRLKSASNLKEISERLQTRISELLQRSLNFDQIGRIEIMVTSFGKSDVDEPPAEEPSTETPAEENIAPECESPVASKDDNPKNPS